MKILSDAERVGGFPGPVHLAIGAFDGVHLGHQMVIRQTLDAEVPGSVPRIYLQGDICRQNLLTEIDGIVGCQQLGESS